MPAIVAHMTFKRSWVVRMISSPSLWYADFPITLLANQEPLSPWSAGFIQLAENLEGGLGKEEGGENFCLTTTETFCNLGRIHTNPPLLRVSISRRHLARVFGFLISNLKVGGPYQ